MQVDMKAEHVISYRLTDAEVESLQVLQLPGEKSVSMVAKRLLQQYLGLSAPESTIVNKVDNVDAIVDKVVDAVVDTESTVVDKIVDSSKFVDLLESKLLESKLAELVDGLSQKFAAHEERLEALEKLEA